MFPKKIRFYSKLRYNNDLVVRFVLSLLHNNNGGGRAGGRESPQWRPQSLRCQGPVSERSQLSTINFN